jgi:hypothetical protein
MSMLPALEGDTPCKSILLAVEMNTPCTSILLLVEGDGERDTQCTIKLQFSGKNAPYTFIDGC